MRAAGIGFAPGTTVTARCVIDNGHGWTQHGATVQLDVADDGSVLFEGDCYLTQETGQIKVVIADVESNTLTS